MAEKNINSLQEKESSIESLQEKSSVSDALEKVDSSIDVADIMEGVEMGEVSERVGESKDPKGGAKKAQKKQKDEELKKKNQENTARPLPSNNVMRRRVVASMKKDERVLHRELSKLEGDPYEYAEKVKKIRSLRQRIAEFLKEKLEKVKDFYLKIFGKLHGLKEDEE